jgi:hypothetical protein
VEAAGAGALVGTRPGATGVEADGVLNEAGALGVVAEVCATGTGSEDVRRVARSAVVGEAVVGVPAVGVLAVARGGRPSAGVGDGFRPKLFPFAHPDSARAANTNPASPSRRPSRMDIPFRPPGPVRPPAFLDARHGGPDLSERARRGQEQARRAAFRRTPSSMGWVSLPVKVFCWLGW